MSKVSVIMLTYNRQEYVGRAITAILSQTMRDFEFIIIDNGSSDRSGEICDEFAKQDDRIKVFHISKSTIGTGRNVGIGKARGDYITFVDDDDYAEPEMIEHLLKSADDYDADISVCGSEIEYLEKKVPKYVFDDIYLFTGEEAVVAMLNRQLFNSANPTKLFKRMLFDKYRYDEVGKYDDARAMYKIFSVAEKVVVTGKPLYTFQRHVGNNSGGLFERTKMNDERIGEYISIVKERTEWLNKRFHNNDFWRFEEISFYLSMYDCVEDERLKTELKKFIIDGADFFLEKKHYYLDRDKELVEKYKQMLLENHAKND